MGLFDNLFGDKSSANRELSKQEAFAGILLGASACDGHISEEEVQSLFTTTERMKLYENMVPAKWNSMMPVTWFWPTALSKTKRRSFWITSKKPSLSMGTRR